MLSSFSSSSTSSLSHQSPYPHHQTLEDDYHLSLLHSSTMFWNSLNLKNCLADNPAYRQDLASTENALYHLESAIKSLNKLCKVTNDSGRVYNERNIQFADELYKFGKGTSDEDPILESTLSKFSQTLKEVERSRSLLLSHMNDVLISPLENFLNTEVSEVKDCKKSFDSASDNLDNVLDRYMGKKPHDPTIPEAAKEVAEARKQFHETSIHYAMKLNDLRGKKKYDILENVIALMYTYYAFYHQGYDLFKDLEPHMRKLTDVLHQTRARHELDIEEMQKQKDLQLSSNIHMYNPMNRGFIDNTKSSTNKPFPDLKPGEKILKSGYLFKKNQVQRMRATWSRRFFAVKGELLVYSHRVKDEDPVIAMNLRYSTVKPAENIDRRFCFEVISAQKSYMLQAENEEDMHSWIEALQRAIGNALHSAEAPSSQGLKGSKERLSTDNLEIPSLSATTLETSRALEDQKAVIEKIRKVGGNTTCSDCGAEDPEWASINLGVVLCIECSGIHRSLGVHISKVRSLILDKWDPETVTVMEMLGNDKVNQVYEANINKEKPKPTAERSAKEKWIHAKWVTKEFLAKDTSVHFTNNSAHLTFWETIDKCDLPLALKLITIGANVDWANPAHNNQTPLHRAIRNRDEAAIEFLLQWQCDVNVQDNEGSTPLHYGADMDNARLVVRLLKKNAKWDMKDHHDKTPLELALSKANVQVVTVLRLFTFNQEHASQGSTKFGFQEAIKSISGSSKSVASSGSDLATSPPSTASRLKAKLIRKEKSDGSVDNAGVGSNNKLGSTSERNSSDSLPTPPVGGSIMLAGIENEPVWSLENEVVAGVNQLGVNSDDMTGMGDIGSMARKEVKSPFDDEAFDNPW